MNYWKPNTTVAALVERDGQFLMVREHTPDGIRINQPAGHLDPGESLEQAAIRETLEETAWHVEPMSCVGAYMGRFQRPDANIDVTYLRFAFVCRPVAFDASRPLDAEIIEALWMHPDDIRGCVDLHRSPLVMKTLDDYLAGKRFPLSFIHTDSSCLYPHV